MDPSNLRAAQAIPRDTIVPGPLKRSRDDIEEDKWTPYTEKPVCRPPKYQKVKKTAEGIFADSENEEKR